MKIYCSMNQKGGIGKTMTAASIAYYSGTGTRKESTGDRC